MPEFLKSPNGRWAFGIVFFVIFGKYDNFQKNMTICKNCHIFIWQFQYDNFFENFGKYDNIQYDNIFENRWYMTIYQNSYFEKYPLSSPFNAYFFTFWYIQFSSFSRKLNCHISMMTIWIWHNFWTFLRYDNLWYDNYFQIFKIWLFAIWQ